MENMHTVVRCSQGYNKETDHLLFTKVKSIHWDRVKYMNLNKYFSRKVFIVFH